MSTKFSVANNAVNQHASNLDTSIGQLNSQAASFLSAIEGLPAVWKGSSFTSWDQLSQAWHAAMRDLNGALADIKGRVGDAGAIYDRGLAQQTDDLNAAMAGANWDGTKFRG